MSSIIVHKPVISIEGDKATVSSKIKIGDKDETVWYAVDKKYLDINHDYSSVFLAMIMQIAMARRENIVVKGSVSERLMSNLPLIQNTFHRWFPDIMKIIKVEADHTTNSEIAIKGLKKSSASFFSGGVDSFYTAEQHRDEIGNLIFVHGFDINVENKKFFSKVSNHLVRSVDALSKNLIIVQTNLREISDLYVSWPDHYHGSALGSVAVLLSGAIDKVYVSASQMFGFFRPYGSNLLTDGLWATEGLSIVYDGYTESRFEKIVSIAHNKVAQKHLRVCWVSESDYNCSECEKCVRTMMSLEAAGALGSFTTFTKPLNLESIANADIGDRSIETYAWPPYSYLAENGRADSPLALALKRLIDRTTEEQACKRANQSIDYLLQIQALEPAEGEIIAKLWEKRTKRMLSYAPKAIITKLIRKARLS